MKTRAKSYMALNAHAEDTSLRVVVKEHSVEFWIGKRQGRDYPRLARLKLKQAEDLANFLQAASLS